MRWINHKLLTGAIMYAITENITLSLITAGGSVIPDAIEGFPKDEEAAGRWRKQHRRLSHWFLPYILTAALLFAFVYFSGAKLISVSHISINSLFYHDSTATYPIIARLFGFLCLGACFHVCQDALCGKVPSLDPHKRIGVKLFYVGSAKEYFLVITVSAFLVAIKYYL